MTPMASPYTGTSMRGASHRQAAIMDRFSSTGVKAGTAKRRQVFSTPDAKAISDMHRMYGNITRVIQTAAPNSASRAAPQPAGHGRHHPGRGDDADQRDQHQRQRQQQRHAVQQRAHLVVGPVVARRAQDRHESLRESPFREQPPQQVRNAESDPERIGNGTRAKGARHQDVTGQAGNAGQQREAADGGRGAEQTHFSYP